MRMWAFSFYIFFYSFVTLSVVEVSAQVTDKTFDAAFSSLKDGNGKVDSLNKLCRLFDDNKKAIACEKKTIVLAEKTNYTKGIAQALNNIGVAYYNLEDRKSTRLNSSHLGI